MSQFRLLTGLRDIRLFAAAIAILLFLQVLAPAAVSAAADTQAPSAPTGLTAANVTCTTISLVWTAAKDNTEVKGYHLFRDGKKLLSTSKTSYTNSDLIPGRKYTFMVKAYDAAGNISADSTPFTAVTANDGQNPSQPAGLSIVSQSHTQITITWNPSNDNTGIKSYEISCSEKKAAVSTSTYYTIKSLQPGKSYTIYVKACDIAGNYSVQSSTLTAATTPDTQPPSAPAGLKAASVSGMEVDLSWSPSSDDVKVKSYDVFCDGVKLKSTTKLSLTCSKLIPGKSYSYTVRAVDSTGNSSGFSSPLKVTTTADTEAPTIPTGLKVKSATKSSAALTWTASTDNNKVKGYRIYWNGLQIAETTQTHYTVKSPLKLGFDVFTVRAFDLNGNLSASSSKAVAISLN